jgi:type I restriction enzyme M protein
VNTTEATPGKKPVRATQTLAKRVREALLSLGGEAHRAMVIEQVAKKLGHDTRQIPEDLQDIDGHLRGGTPDRDLDALEPYWKVFPGVRTALFATGNRPGYSQLRVAAVDIKTTIFGHAEFTAWSTQTKKCFTRWRAEAAPRLTALKKGDKPKALIDELSEQLLATFQKAKLIDAYDVYQHLMDYWAEVMQDDVYLIVSDGWREAAKPRLLVEDRDKKTKDKPDLVIGKQKYKTELIPMALLIARHFATERAAIEALESEALAVAQAMDELIEQHGGDDGLLADAKNDKDKVTRAAAAAQLKEIKNDRDAVDERKVLGEFLALTEKESEINAKAKAAQETLTDRVFARYGKLTDDDIKVLVIDGKWMAAAEAAVQGELDRVSQTLTGRVHELAERYATPLRRIVDEVTRLAARVDKQLKSMGASWT